MLTVGSILIADWQTIGNDSCRIYSPYDYYNNNDSVSASCMQYKSYSYCMEMQTAAESSNFTTQANELCQATQGCHWNQFSVITNSLCINCPAICRNIHHSLNIAQFTVGAVIFMIAITMGDLCVSLLLSNNLQEHEQVLLS